jgi:hypothetical protein
LEGEISKKDKDSSRAKFGKKYGISLAVNGGAGI